MALPKITYGSGYSTTLQMVRGPQNLRVYWLPTVVTDNVATSGAARERVVAAMPLIVEFDTTALRVDDDIEGWMTFASAAMGGAGFRFYPNAGLSDYYNCVLEQQEVGPARGAFRRYGQHWVVRVLVDGQSAGVTPATVLRRLHGVTG